MTLPPGVPPDCKTVLPHFIKKEKAGSYCGGFRSCLVQVPKLIAATVAVDVTPERKVMVGSDPGGAGMALSPRLGSDAS